MSAEQELFQKIQWAGRVEPLDFLPSSPSFFQRKLAELVIWKLGLDWDSSQIGFQTTCKETFDRLSPLVNFLTQPRSIAEFQDLKRCLLDTLWNYDPYLRSKRKEGFENEEEARIGKVVNWLNYLLPEIKIFPYMEMESLFCGQDPEEIWEVYEKLGPRPFRRIEEKKVSFEQAVKLAEKVHQTEEGQLGYVIGKWRLGPHTEHVALFEDAKQVLGTDGVLFVGVESQKSIWERRGRDHFALEDEERLKRIAAIEAVDYVVLFAPTGKELENLRRFYYQCDKKLYRDFWFVGTQDYHWRPEFEKRAKELGVILLWHSPTARLSSTELIAQIRTAG